MKVEGLPVIDVDESEKITVAVRADDLLEGDIADPERHPIAIALRSQDDVDDARDEERDAGPPWQEVVPLPRPGQAVVQGIAKDAVVAGLVYRSGPSKICIKIKNPKAPVAPWAAPGRRGPAIIIAIY